jgi:periplasmic divalent cation tolerance protein
LLYVPVGSTAEGEDLATRLLDARLIACANLIPQITSIYAWHGEIQNAQESVLIAKTKRDLSEKAREFIEDHHSYQCPCVLTVDLAAVNPDYGEWLSEQL